ncbi:TPR-like protein [Imleria badia]|nr:TPR-like protein [Imleria badia]
MASEKARVAKDKGNAAFKAADYPTAIGHYTEAILADSSDHTFFLNRAAAYLKLGKSEDAERDCTKVLVLNSNNVKAFFRRGQARRALGNLEDARADLDRALALGPTDKSVKNEILELDKLSQQQELKQYSKYIAVGTPKNTAPKRRRVPIDIVEDDTRSLHRTQTATTSETKDTDLLQPVSSRPLKQESEPTTTQVPPSRPQTFVDAKQARDGSKPVRVSGGIIRHTGNHTIVTRTSSEAASSTRESTPQPTPSNTNAPRSQKPPTTLFQFTKSWESLQSDTGKWNLIRTIPPSSVPALFQVSLEPELLRSVLHTFQAVLEQDPASDTRDSVRDYLLAFTKVQRFGTVMLFMDKRERQLLELLHEKVNSVHS